MRKTKFRGKTPTGQWVYGSFLDDADAWICDHKLPSDPELPLLIVNRKSVGQFTGLHDVNGNEVYEGDIIRYHFDGVGGKVGKIAYEDKFMRFQVERSDGQINIAYNINGIEVIGNMFEHGETFLYNSAIPF